MATNRIQIELIVNGKKQLFEAVQATENLERSASRASGAQTRLGQAAERANRHYRDSSVYHAKNARDIKTLREEIGSGNNGLVGAYATLAVNTFAVVAAFNALDKAMAAQKQIAGLEAQGARLGRTLSITAQEVRNITNNAVSMADAMRSTAQLTAGGFSSKQIAELAQVAKDASGALGRDLSDSMDRLSRGVTKLEPELLDELGIMTKLQEATDNYAVILNKSSETLTSAEKRQAFMNAVLDEGQRKFGGIGDQVSEYDAYIRLAAAATDLFNTAVGNLAIVLAPIVELFANNQWLLAGAVIAYAGTIRKDLIPALTEAANRQQELARNRVLLQGKALEDFAELRRQLTDEGALTKGGKIQPKTITQTAFVMDEISEKVEKNILTTQDLEIASRKVTDALSEQQDRLDSINRADTKRYNLELSRLNEIKEAHNRILGVQQARVIASVETARAELYGRAAESTNPFSIGAGRAFRDIRQQATTGLTDPNTVAGWQRLSANINNATIHMSAFGTAAGAASKAIGITLLNTLPVIGQVIMALTLLSVAWEAIKNAITTKEQKEYNKIQEDFNSIIEQASVNIKEYNRLTQQTTNVSANQLDAIILTGNAVDEVITKYEELAAARAAAGKSSIWDEITGDTSSDTRAQFLKDFDELKRSADQFSFQNIRKITGQTAGAGLFGMADAISDLMEAQDTLKDIGPETETLIAIYGQANLSTKAYIQSIVESADAAVTTAEKQKILSEGLKIVKERFQGSAIAAENLKEAFKDLEESTTKFIQSSVQSTPFDDLYESLIKTNSAVGDMQVSMLRGAMTLEEFGTSLTDIRGQSRNLLSAGTLTQLVQFDSLNAQVAALDKLGEKRTDREQELLVALKLQAETLATQLGPAIQRDLNNTEELVRLNQSNTRHLKDQIVLEKARYEKAKDLFQVGAEGIAAQQEFEENQRNMQVAQLQAERSLLVILQQQAKTNLDNLETEKNNLRIRIENLKYAKEQAEQGRRIAASSIIESAEGREILDKSGWLSRAISDVFSPDKVNFDELIRQANADLTAMTKNIDAAKNTMSQYSDAIDSIDTQIAIILAQSLSEAEKSAAQMAGDLEVSAKFLEQAKDYATAIVETNKSIRQINRLVTSTNDTILTQLEEIKLEYQRNRDILVADLATKAATLKVDLAQLKSRQENSVLTEVGVAASERSLSVAQKEYDNERLITEQKLEQAEATMNLQILELAVYDVRKEGLEWQKQGLELLQKESELIQSIRDKQLEIINSRIRISRNRAGLSDTEESRRNDELRAAADALRSVKMQAGIRMSVIDAEYALLEAQRVMLIEELSARSAILEQYGASIEYLAPIANAISLLDRIDYGELSNLAKEGIRLEVQAADQLVLEKLDAINNTFKHDEGSFLGRFLARQYDKQEEDSARRSAEAARLQEVTEEISIKVAKTTDTGIQQLKEVQAKSMNPIYSTTQQLASDVRDIRNHLLGGGGTADLSSLNVGLGKEMLAYLKSKGISDVHAAAIVNNAKFESDFNPGNIGDSGTSFGLFQHHKERGTAMKAFVGPDWKTNWKKQIDFLLQEKESKKFLEITFPDAVSASRWFTENVERPANRVAEGIRRAAALGGTNAVIGPAMGATDERPSTNLITPLRDQLDKELPNALTDFPQIIPAIIAESDIERIKSYSIALREIEEVTSDMRIQTEGQRKFEEFGTSVQEFGEVFKLAVQPLYDLAQQLGPEGEMVIAISEGVATITNSLVAMTKVFSDPNSNFADKFVAIAAVAQQMVSTISAITAAASNARIRAIEAEIAAEQRRDGQSAASQAKIEALEKRKDQIQRKQFNLNKKLMMAQAIIGTAAGIAMALGSMPPPGNIILAAIIGAMGLAQLAIIAGTTYQGGTKSNAGKIMPPKLTIGRVGDKVNLDRPNPNAGGEIGYLRGTPGYGKTAYNYSTIGSAYGGQTNRGYGHRSFLVGEKGPETISTEEPMTVTPIRREEPKQGDTFIIQATDAESFENMLRNNPGPIAEGIRKLANSNGVPFLEDINTRGFKPTKR